MNPLVSKVFIQKFSASRVDATFKDSINPYNADIFL